MDNDTAAAFAAVAGALERLAEASRRQAEALEAIVNRSDSIERQLRVQTRAGQQLRARLQQGQLGPVRRLDVVPGPEEAA